MERNKATVAKSGIDPGMKRLSRLHAIRSAQERKLIRALESIENYWAEVFAAVEAKENEAA